MTDILVGGVVREGLVSADGQLRVAATVREALVSGVGLFARGSAVQSRARGSLLISAAVYGRIRGRSTARGGMVATAVVGTGFNRAVTVFT